MLFPKQNLRQRFAGSVQCFWGVISVSRNEDKTEEDREGGKPISEVLLRCPPLWVTGV